MKTTNQKKMALAGGSPAAGNNSYKRMGMDAWSEAAFDVPISHGGSRLLPGGSSTLMVTWKAAMLVVVMLLVTSLGLAQEAVIRSADLYPNLSNAVAQINAAKAQNQGANERIKQWMAASVEGQAKASNPRLPTSEQFGGHVAALSNRVLVARERYRSFQKVGNFLDSANSALERVLGAVDISQPRGPKESFDFLDGKSAPEIAAKQDGAIGDFLGNGGGVPEELVQGLADAKDFFDGLCQENEPGAQPINNLRALKDNINRWRANLAKAMLVAQNDVAGLEMSAIDGMTRLAAYGIGNLPSVGNGGLDAGLPRVPKAPSITVGQQATDNFGAASRKSAVDVLKRR